ncbi:MAG: TonB-dependent receptor [Prevotella sp.]|nr:TonB-dependent receptor [Prevotella sp.]
MNKKPELLSLCRQCLFEGKQRFLLVLLVMMLSVATGFAQGVNVKGRVIDKNGDPVIGASVIEVGSKGNGTVTDIDGNYSITLKSRSSQVSFSAIGYETVKISVKGRAVIDVEMKDDVNMIDELVVVGYGKLRKSDLTGAMASISSEELMRGTPTDFGSGLQGKIAGVQVNRNDGAPGAGISITIRGANSTSTSTQPLYVIDGIPFETSGTPKSDANSGNNTVDNPLSMINPNDIENIEVLKDASATAIYGSRGANGVVLVTTKQGKAGAQRIEFSANWGVMKISKKIKMLDAYTYANYVNEGIVNGSIYDGLVAGNPSYSGKWSYRYDSDNNLIPESGSYHPLPEDFLTPGWHTDGYGNTEWVEGTNWLDEVTQTGSDQTYNLSISGGSDKSNYAISGNYTNQEGVIKNSGYERYTFRTNVNSNPLKWLKAGLNINFTHSENKFSKTNSYDYSIIRSALIYLPTIYVGDKSDADTYAWLSANPRTYVNTAKDEMVTTNIFTSAYLEANITPYLSFRQNLGISNINRERDTYYNRETGEGKTAKGRAGKADNWNTHITLESMLTFDKTFGKHHRLNAVAAFTYERSNWGGKSMTASNFPTDLTQDYDMSAAMTIDTPTSDRGRSTMVSLLGRVNYTLMDRYIATLSYRRDGSSKFAEGNKFANFASGALAWNISEEKFIKDLNIFSNLKLRLSYGQTGNQALSDYMTMDRVRVANYPLGGSLNGGYTYDTGSGPRNTKLRWETTDQFNVGLDMGFMRNRLSFSMNWYLKETNDLLQTISIPTNTGYRTMWTNSGSVRNTGFELSGNFVVVDTRDWGLELDANISWNRNRLFNLPADQYASQLWYGASQVFIQRNDMPIGAIYGYVEDGFYDNIAEVRADPMYRTVSDAEAQRMVGEIKYVDVDGDGQLTADRDRVVIGDTNPDYTYGFNVSGRWKKLSLSMFFQGTQGNDVYNGNLMMIGMSSIGNITQDAYNTRWTPENASIAKWPRVTTAMTRNMLLSNRYVEDGSYFRLKTVSLEYDFGRIARTVGLRAYFTASNLFTITGYSWFDPDVNAFGTDASRRGVDINSYPNNRSFSFGVKLTL